MLLCLICTVVVVALFASGNKEQVYAFALSEQESISNNYYEAVELGIVAPMENCILSQYDHQKIQPLWGSGGHDLTTDITGTHPILARIAYSFVQPLFPDVFDPLKGEF